MGKVLILFVLILEFDQAIRHFISLGTILDVILLQARQHKSPNKGLLTDQVDEKQWRFVKIKKKTKIKI